MPVSFHTGSRPYAEVLLNGKPVRTLVDSVAGDTSMLYWRVGDRVKFGSIEELFLEYSSAQDKYKYKILSLRRNPRVRERYNQSLNLNNAEPFFSDIKDVVYHGIRPVWRVTLRNGKIIEVTQDHSIFTSLAYSKKMESKSIFEINEKEAVVSVDNYGFDSQMTGADLETLTFMGLWIADGSYYRDRGRLNGVSISTGNEVNIINWLDKFTLRYPSRMPYMKTKTGMQISISVKGDVHINRGVLAEEMFDVFGEVDSYTKRVPEFVFTSGNEQIAAFLRGYFSGDGSIHLCNSNPTTSNYKYGAYYAVDCASVNRKLLEDISVLLDRLGIKHNISSPTKPGSNGFYTTRLQYKLIIHQGPAVDKFMKLIGFIKEHIYTRRQRYRDKKQRPVSPRRIRSIECIGPKPVYDISVPETELFIVNGIAAHNSGNDITLLPTEVADRIGIPWRSLPDGFDVKGVAKGVSVPFKIAKIPLQIGGGPPVTIPVGIGDVRDPLLGREGVEDHFDTTHSKGRVTFSQHGAASNGLGLSFPARANVAYCTDGVCCDTRVSNCV